MFPLRSARRPRQVPSYVRWPFQHGFARVWDVDVYPGMVPWTPSIPSFPFGEETPTSAAGGNDHVIKWSFPFPPSFRTRRRFLFEPDPIPLFKGTLLGTPHEPPTRVPFSVSTSPARPYIRPSRGGGLRRSNLGLGGGRFSSRQPHRWVPLGEGEMAGFVWV